VAMNRRAQCRSNVLQYVDLQPCGAVLRATKDKWRLRPSGSESLVAMMQATDLRERNHSSTVRRFDEARLRGILSKR
jgi:hypothetical protein